MILQSRFIAVASLIGFCSLAAPPVQAGQLFPPDNIGANPNVSCPNGGVLTWHGDRVDCVNPTPGVSVSCPPGHVLTGISNGSPICISSNIQVMKVNAGSWYLASNDRWYSDATAVCPSGMIATGGGGNCDAAAGAGVTALIYSNPVGATAYYASCTSGNPSSTNPEGRGVTAYIYCIRIQQ
jgi:hypothetical protein